MKMSRRELRKSIFLLLFRIEFNTREELQEQTEMFLEEKPDISEADSSYIRDKVRCDPGCSGRDRPHDYEHMYRLAAGEAWKDRACHSPAGGI